MKALDGRQAAVTLHQLQASTWIQIAQLPLQTADVTLQGRSEVGVKYGGVAACDVTDERRELVGHRDFLETDFARDAGGRALVLLMTPAM
jgi:hypothetical protein